MRGLSRAAFLPVLVVLFVASCSSGATSPSGSSPLGSAAAPVKTAGVIPTKDSTLFGSFDLATMKQRYGSTFTTATVEGGLMRYVTNVGGVELDFMIDPNDAAKVLIQTSATIDDVSRSQTSAETAAIDAWFASLGSQPNAVAWIRGHLTDYLEAPGAEINIKQDFGPVRAGFFTLVPGLNPVAGAPATIVGFYIEDRVKLDH